MTTSLHLLKRRYLFAGGLLLCAAGAALAVTLGPNTRSAMLGQPLDISVQVLLDAGEEPTALCLDASVFYADRQLDKSKVQVSTEKLVKAQESVIRIRSATPVEGPVVTVHLVAGCVQKTSRRYAILAVAPSRSQAHSADSSVPAVSVQGSVAAGTQENSPNAERMPAAVESELRQMREELAKSQAALAESRVRLETVQSERKKAQVYGVAGLAAFALAGVLFLWLQRSGPRAVLEESRPSLRKTTQGFGESDDEQDSRPHTSIAETSDSKAEPDSGIDESLFDELKRFSQRAPLEPIPPLPRRDRARFSVSVPFVQRTVKVPELFDLQQQVEFFSSLGQQDKAIALLREHLVNNVKTSALVYLDLLHLYQLAGNETDYEVLRADFNRVFGTNIPPYPGYNAAATDTPAYQAVQARLVDVWPTRRVSEVIEDALFREPGNPDEVLELEAYRELLLLYAVAREIREMETDTAGSSADTHWPDLAMQPRSSPRLGLDIDLSQLSRGDRKARDADASSQTPEGRRRRTPADAGPSSIAALIDNARQKDRARTGAGSAGSGPQSPSSLDPTALDSLVDFDDYDTGFRPDDFGKTPRS